MKTNAAFSAIALTSISSDSTTEGISLCPPAIEIRVAQTKYEVDAAFRIRHEIFVNEQKIYKDSDMDHFDSRAIIIIAKVNDQVVGTVRCYRKSAGTWFGGRLAVLAGFRKYNLGAGLVRKAVETMEARNDVDRFMATIQIQNVRFFRRLGWETMGRRFLLNGVRHWMMCKPLNAEKSNS